MMTAKMETIKVINEIMVGVLVFVAGCVIGLFFYGGLYLTVAKSVMLVSKSGKLSALWFPGSHLLRTCAALGGFYLVSSGDWKRLMLCLMGFLVGRIAVSQYTKRPQKYLMSRVRGVHAP